MIILRLKNVKGASEVILKSFYVLKHPEKYKGKYHLVFKNNNPICVEIGMGKGDFIIGMAKKHPNVNYVGIEMYDSVIVRAVQKLAEQNLPNLRLINMDASMINDVFLNEVDTLYLNFSDPWPKKRHAKRRLTSHEFLKKYDGVFKADKKIFQKTDNVDLFSYSIESLSTYGYVLKNVTMDLYANMIDDNVQTEYEKRFVSENVKICRLEAYKK